MIYSIGEALIDIFGSGTDTARRAGGASVAFCSTAASLKGRASLITSLEIRVRGGGDILGNLRSLLHGNARGGRKTVAERGTRLDFRRKKRVFAKKVC